MAYGPLCKHLTRGFVPILIAFRWIVDHTASIRSQCHWTLWSSWWCPTSSHSLHLILWYRVPLKLFVIRKSTQESLTRLHGTYFLHIFCSKPSSSPARQNSGVDNTASLSFSETGPRQSVHDVLDTTHQISSPKDNYVLLSNAKVDLFTSGWIVSTFYTQAYSMDSET